MFHNKYIIINILCRILCLIWMPGMLVYCHKGFHHLVERGLTFFTSLWRIVLIVCWKNIHFLLSVSGVSIFKTGTSVIITCFFLSSIVKLKGYIGSFHSPLIHFVNFLSLLYTPFWCEGFTQSLTFSFFLSFFL